MTIVEVSVRAAVNPTESREKVETAIKNIIGDTKLEALENGGITVLTGRFKGLDSLNRLRDLLRRMRIRDAARALFLRSDKEGQISFGLNKQAAYAGKISFYRSGGSPLGPIQIIIEGDIESAIDYLCR